MFSKYVCWRPEMVDHVLDTEALQPTKAEFLATHHPIRMYQAATSGGAPPTEYSEREFLRDFLAPKDYVFAVILGEAGTGKSHLVRWLEMNITASARRKVLLIPKVGTNLKGVIGRILQGMEGGKFDTYRRRLEEGTQAISDAEARERLLDNLAIAVGPDQPRSRQLSESEAFLTRRLPDFLRDPILRRQLVEDGGRVDELVVHTLGRGERAERSDRPKEFTILDLPLDVTNQPDLSIVARNFHAQLIGNEELLVATIAWINENLGSALRQLINFSGENLSDLMLDVRESLAEQGVELIILVEDFAKLQGLDRQLLEAFLVRTHQEGRKPLCALRTAVALTTGYFDRLEETVKTRIKFRVLMDVAAAGAGNIVTPDDLEHFTARYLNAIRLPEMRLKRWLEDAEDGNPEDPAPSACDGCPHRDRCHPAFGERDGYGLYPFNATAIQRMTNRVSPRQFNPRTIINRVLKDTFEKYTDALREEQFPPLGLQKQLGRSQLSAALVSEIRQKDPLNSSRRQVLLDLWTDGTRLVDLPEAVHEAFVLPPLGTEIAHGIKPTEPATTHIVKQGVVRHDAEIPEVLSAQLKELDDWHNGEVLSQRTQQTLRELVYRAVFEYVDWDAELLIRKSFAGTGGTLFQQRYVSFANKEARQRTGAYQLTVPVLHTDLNSATLALQGLLLYQHFGHWRFKAGTHPNGSRLRREFARQLETWASEVLGEVRRPTRSGTEWNPVPAAAELLYIGARLHGRPTGQEPTLADYVDAMFDDWPPQVDDADRTPVWRDLAAAFRRRRRELADVVLSRAAGTKGGSSRVQIVDVAQLRPVLTNLLHTWLPEAELPPDPRTEYAFLADLQSRYRDAIGSAVASERARLLSWDTKVSEALGDANREEIISALRESLSEAERVGVAAANRGELASALDAFPGVTLDRLRRSVQRLREADDFGTQLVEVSRASGDAIQTATRVFSAAISFLDRTGERVRFERMQAQGGESDRVSEIEQKLLDTLQALESELADAATEAA